MFEGSSFGHLESSFTTNKSIIKSNKKMMNTTITSNKARATIPKAMVMLDDTTTLSATQDQSGITSS
jgi:hypothetical protein